MDINDRIAARRRELEAEARRVQALEAQNKAQEAQRQAESQRRVNEVKRQQQDAERVALDRAVTTRLQEEGIKIPAPSDEKVKAEIEARLNKAAADRMTTGESSLLTVLVILALGSFFVAWWLGLLFLVLAIGHYHKATEKYKKEMLSGRLQEEVDKRFGKSNHS